MVATLNWLLAHWWVFLWLAIFGVFEGVRDFFIGIAHAIGAVGETRHRRRMKELKLQARLAAAPVTALPVKPGPCVHRNVVPVVAKDDSVVAWLCRTCDERLPHDWAVREEDL